MKNIETIEDFIEWLDEIDASLDEDLNVSEDATDTEPADTPEDDVQLVQDLALTAINNGLLQVIKDISECKMPTADEAQALVMIYQIAKDNSNAT